MRTEFPAAGARLQAARVPRSACDTQVSPLHLPHFTAPDLPKPLGAHSLQRNPQKCLFHPLQTKHPGEHGVAVQGSAVLWGAMLFGSCSALRCVWSYISSLPGPLMLLPAKICQRKGPCLPGSHVQQGTDSRAGFWCPCHRKKPSEEAKQDMSTLQSPTCCP